MTGNGGRGTRPYLADFVGRTVDRLARRYKWAKNNEKKFISAFDKLDYAYYQIEKEYETWTEYREAAIARFDDQEFMEYIAELGHDNAIVYMVKNYDLVKKADQETSKYLFEKFKELNTSCYRCIRKITEELKNPDSTYFSKENRHLVLNQAGAAHNFCDYNLRVSVGSKIKEHVGAEKFQEIMNKIGYQLRNNHKNFDDYYKEYAQNKMAEMQSQLELYAKALSGVPLKVESTGFSRTSQFNGESVLVQELTPYVNETNARELYLTTIAHQTGHLEFGSYDINLEELK
jgi:hypothetical protein